MRLKMLHASSPGTSLPPILCVNLVTNRSQSAYKPFLETETTALAALALASSLYLLGKKKKAWYLCPLSLLWPSLHMLVSSGPCPPLPPKMSCTIPQPQLVLT